MVFVYTRSSKLYLSSNDSATTIHDKMRVRDLITRKLLIGGFLFAAKSAFPGTETGMYPIIFEYVFIVCIEIIVKNIQHSRVIIPTQA